MKRLDGAAGEVHRAEDEGEAGIGYMWCAGRATGGWGFTGTAGGEAQAGRQGALWLRGGVRGRVVRSSARRGFRGCGRAANGFPEGTGFVGVLSAWCRSWSCLARVLSFLCALLCPAALAFTSPVVVSLHALVELPFLFGFFCFFLNQGVYLEEPFGLPQVGVICVGLRFFAIQGQFGRRWSPAVWLVFAVWGASRGGGAPGRSRCPLRVARRGRRWGKTPSFGCRDAALGGSRLVCAWGVVSLDVQVPEVGVAVFAL